MGNTIGVTASTPGKECLYMSNGLTDVFLNVLVLGGSALARTDSEKRLVVWLAEKDQSRMGYGAIGFDLYEMPWALDTFESDKEFLLQTVAAARNRMNWEKLDYHPNEDTLFPSLDQFAKLVSELDANDIQPDCLKEWLETADASDPVMCGFPRCPKHQVLLSIFGCQICNS